MKEGEIMQQNTELHRVLLEMKARCGEAAFQKKQQFFAIFSDLAPQLTMEKQLLGIAIDMGVPAMYAGKTVKDLDMINGRVERTLGNFVREDAVQLVQQAFALVYFGETAERPKPVPAEQQPIPKPAQKPAPKSPPPFSPGMGDLVFDHFSAAMAEPATQPKPALKPAQPVKPVPSPASDFEIVDGVLKEYYGIGEEVVVIPDEATRIGKAAFSFSSFLTSVHIPDGVTKIEERAFSYCGALTNVHIPDGVTEIGENAFESCKSLTSVYIPNSVRIIGDEAFMMCEALASVSIPDGVMEIGERAFYNCFSLTSVHIPDSVKRISICAFESCKSLTSVHISNGVTMIGWGAFKGCESLSCIRIPDSVTEIFTGAFKNCPNLHVQAPKRFKHDDYFSGCKSVTYY